MAGPGGGDSENLDITSSAETSGLDAAAQALNKMDQATAAASDTAAASVASANAATEAIQAHTAASSADAAATADAAQRVAAYREQMGEETGATMVGPGPASPEFTRNTADIAAQTFAIQAMRAETAAWRAELPPIIAEEQAALEASNALNQANAAVAFSGSAAAEALYQTWQAALESAGKVTPATEAMRIEFEAARHAAEAINAGHPLADLAADATAVVTPVEHLKDVLATFLEAKGGVAGGAIAGVIRGPDITGAAAAGGDAQKMAQASIQAEGGVLGWAKAEGILSAENAALVAGLYVGVQAAQEVLGVVQDVTAAFIGAASGMEQWTMKFDILEGSASAANERVAALEATSTSLAMPTQDIMAAAFQLEKVGAGALATTDGLRMIADTSVMTGSSMQQTATQFGFLYSEMEAGNGTISRYLLQLVRQGAITAEGQAHITTYAKAVQAGTMTMAEAWPKVEAELHRFGGAAAREADTFAGKMTLMGNESSLVFDKIGGAILPVASVIATVLVVGLQDANVALDATAAAVSAASDIFTAFEPQIAAVAAVIILLNLQTAASTALALADIIVTDAWKAAKIAFAIAQGVVHAGIAFGTGLLGAHTAAQVVDIAAEEGGTVVRGIQAAVIWAENAALAVLNTGIAINSAEDIGAAASIILMAAAEGVGTVATMALSAAMVVLDIVTSPISLILLGIAAAAALLAVAWANDWGGIREDLQPVIDLLNTVKSTVQDVSEQFPVLAQAAGITFKAMTGLWVIDAGQSLIGGIQDFFGGGEKAAKESAEKMIEFGEEGRGRR